MTKWWPINVHPHKKSLSKKLACISNMEQLQSFSGSILSLLGASAAAALLYKSSSEEDTRSSCSSCDGQPPKKKQRRSTSSRRDHFDVTSVSIDSTFPEVQFEVGCSSVLRVLVECVLYLCCFLQLLNIFLLYTSLLTP